MSMPVTLHVDGEDFEVDLHAISGTDVLALHRDLDVSAIELVAHIDVGVVELTEVVALQVLALRQSDQPADVARLLAAVSLGSDVSITTPEIDSPADEQEGPLPPDLLAAAVAQVTAALGGADPTDGLPSTVDT